MKEDGFTTFERFCPLGVNYSFAFIESYEIARNDLKISLRYLSTAFEAIGEGNLNEHTASQIHTHTHDLSFYSKKKRNSFLNS